MTQAADAGFNEELWQTIFGVGHPLLIAKQQRFRLQGAAPRCKLCLAPFSDAGELGTADQPGPSNRNPRYCSLCDVFIRQNPGGARIRLTMIFADVRNSTEMAEQLDLREYVRVMNRFYAESSQIIIDTDGFMLEIIGDQIFALYPTGFSGISPDEPELEGDALVTHRELVAARKAIDAAKRLAPLGLGTAGGAPFGLSVHTAEVYIGTVRGAEEGIVDVRVWGKEVNKAARLSSVAQAGELLISDDTCALVGLELPSLPHRDLKLKGLSDVVGHRVFQS